MPWDNSPQNRQREAQIYGPEYRANRRRLIAQHGNRCMRCQSTDRIQCDHRTPVSEGGTSNIENLELLCISCHGAKTFRQSNAWGGRTRRDTTDPPPRPATQW